MVFRAVCSHRSVADDTDAAALKDLLLWAREHGFAFDAIAIGRVQITAVRDYRPAERDQVQAVARAEALAREQAPTDLASEFGMGPPPGVQ